MCMNTLYLGYTFHLRKLYHLLIFSIISYFLKMYIMRILILFSFLLWLLLNKNSFLNYHVASLNIHYTPFVCVNHPKLYYLYQFPFSVISASFNYFFILTGEFLSVKILFPESRSIILCLHFYTFTSRSN